MIAGADSVPSAGRSASIYLEGRLPLVTAPVARELGLSEGQIVQAKAAAQPSGWALQLPGYLLQLPGELPPGWRLSDGQSLNFRVQLLADGAVLLRPLVDPGAPAPEALLPDRMSQLLFRPPGGEALQLLLQPATLDQLLQTVRRMAPELAAGLMAWMQQRTGMAQITPARLQQLLMQGGWMTEALLAQGRFGEFTDLKSTLRSLLRGLSGASSELRGLLQDALDDVESRQLRASESATGREWALSMVLPFVDAYPVDIKFAWQRPEPDQPSRFMIQLHTTSPALGDLWLQSQVTDLSRVDLVMWAERLEIAQQAQARSASLAEELDSAGLRLGQLQIIHGRRPVSTEPDWRPPASGSMVDVAT